MASVTAATLNLIFIVTLNKVNVKIIRIIIILITIILIIIRSMSTLRSGWWTGRCLEPSRTMSKASPSRCLPFRWIWWSSSWSSSWMVIGDDDSRHPLSRCQKWWSCKDGDNNVSTSVHQLLRLPYLHRFLQGEEKTPYHFMKKQANF